MTEISPIHPEPTQPPLSSSKEELTVHSSPQEVNAVLGDILHLVIAQVHLTNNRAL